MRIKIKIIIRTQITIKRKLKMRVKITINIKIKINIPWCDEGLMPRAASARRPVADVLRCLPRKRLG